MWKPSNVPTGSPNGAPRSGRGAPRRSSPPSPQQPASAKPRGQVRKNGRTDREQIEVPTRREEVSVERVPVSEGTASEAQIGEDEISVPVTEEEVVVEKRPVAKEEVRIRKDVVSDTEVVEEDVRKEEVEVDDQTTRGV